MLKNERYGLKPMITNAILDLATARAPKKPPLKAGEWMLGSIFFPLILVGLSLNILGER